MLELIGLLGGHPMLLPPAAEAATSYGIAGGRYTPGIGGAGGVQGLLGGGFDPSQAMMMMQVLGQLGQQDQQSLPAPPFQRQAAAYSPLAIYSGYGG